MDITEMKHEKRRWLITLIVSMIFLLYIHSLYHRKPLVEHRNTNQIR